MYMGLARTRAWLEALRATIDRDGLPRGVELFVIPTFLSLADAGRVLAGAGIALGAQDVFWEDAGAYTGEISAPMLVEAGCRYVAIGHAERRRIFGETDAIVRDKVAAAVRAGLVPLLCIGESTSGSAEEAVRSCARQLAAATRDVDPDAPLVVAWEPVWAIGAAEPAGADYIRAVADGLQHVLADRSATRLIYGGSAGPGLLACLGSAVDGLFLGRFAHDVGSLRRVLDEAAASS